MKYKEGAELARSIIEDGIADSARGLRFTIEHERGARIRYWMGALNHLVHELHKIG